MACWDRQASDLIVADLTVQEVTFLREELTCLEELIRHRLGTCALALPFGVDVDVMVVTDEPDDVRIRRLIAVFLDGQHPREAWSWHEYPFLTELADACDYALRRLPEHGGRVELPGRGPDWFYGALRGVRVMVAGRPGEQMSMTGPDWLTWNVWLWSATGELYALINAAPCPGSDPRRDPVSHD
jgi:hypothetical protein